MIRRKKRIPMIVPTASMGDIAFLLIIFFMLASNFMKQANIKSENPASPDVETQEAAQLSVVLDADATLWFQGEQLNEASQLIGKLEQSLENHRDRPVHVKIDKNLVRKDYLPIIQALSESGATTVLIGDREQL